MGLYFRLGTLSFVLLLALFWFGGENWSCGTSAPQWWSGGSVSLTAIHIVGQWLIAGVEKEAMPCRNYSVRSFRTTLIVLRGCNGVETMEGIRCWISTLVLGPYISVTTPSSVLTEPHGTRDKTQPSCMQSMHLALCPLFGDRILFVFYLK